jgi:DNA adenine methylase
MSEVKFVCSICNYQFKQKAGLDNHKKRKTPCKAPEVQLTQAAATQTQAPATQTQAPATQDRVSSQPNNFTGKKKEELLTLCVQNAITHKKTMTKQQLIELLKAANITPVIPDQTTTTQPISQHLSPIIKWSGGKSDEIGEILKYLPATWDTYLEPFVGGGALYFYLCPQKAVINDIHKDLIALYKSLGEHKNLDIKIFMDANPNTEAAYYNVRDNMTISTDLDRAKQFYYLRKTCFRGMLRYNSSGKMNIPYGRYKTINYSDLSNPAYPQLLARTTILNGSFEKIFTDYNSENNFMFLDPPYDSVFTNYGYCSFGKAEHIKLATCFKQTRIKCLMIIGKTDFISELYRGYIVAEYKKEYKFKLHSGRVGNEINVMHLVIKNY